MLTKKLIVEEIRLKKQKNQICFWKYRLEPTA